jgi:hypothetical protein
MGASQPVGQLRGGLVGGLAVKGHHRGGNAGNSCDLGAPPVLGDKNRLDQIVTAGNGFFDALQNHGSLWELKTKTPTRLNGTGSFYLPATGKQAKVGTKLPSGRYSGAVPVRSR